MKGIRGKFKILPRKKMSEEKYNSDINRTAKLSKHIKFFKFDGSFNLSSGEKLDEINLAYETYGELNDEKNNFSLAIYGTNYRLQQCSRSFGRRISKHCKYQEDPSGTLI